MSNHTPTPWALAPSEAEVWTMVGDDGYPPDLSMCVMAPGESAQEIVANARLIVTAVNNHHELVEALRGLLSCDVDHRTEVKPGTACKCVMAAETILERVGGGE